MKPIHVDRLARFLSPGGSRRVLLGTALAGVLSPLGRDTTSARNKKQQRDATAAKNKKKACPPCKTRKKGKCKANVPDGTVCAGGACQSGSCVPSASQPGPVPGPVTTADATCVSQHTSYSTSPRNAQTFRALRSGKLTSASVELNNNVEGADFDLEIWSVDGANAPSTVLAGTTIANVPATPPGPRTLTGTFAVPATVVQGLLYALVITGRAGQPSGIYGLPTDECPDGMWFYATTPTGAFTAFPGSDLGFATFVTA